MRAPPGPIDLPVLDGGDGLLEYLERREPCVVRGAADAWPGRRRWSPEHFREAYGGHSFPVAPVRKSRLVTDLRRGVVVQEQEMAAFVDGLLRDGSTGYLMAPLEQIPSSMRADTVLPAPCRNAAWSSSKLWVSPRGAVSPIHFDLAHNLHVQMYGRKRFLLYRPIEALSLYPASPWSGIPNFSRVDPVSPDLERYPRFSRAVAHACTLEPGDMVYLPSRFWHHVTSESVSISVNFWWARGLLAHLCRAADRAKRWRGINR